MTFAYLLLSHADEDVADLNLSTDYYRYRIPMKSRIMIDILQYFDIILVFLASFGAPVQLKKEVCYG